MTGKLTDFKLLFNLCSDYPPDFHRFFPQLYREVPFPYRETLPCNSPAIYLCFINVQITNTMKTITIIIAAVLTLQVSSIFASGTDRRSASGSAKARYVEANFLAPATPAEATFEDVSASMVTPVDVVALAPLTPMDVTFEDVPETASDPVHTNLAPVAPAEADFSDPVIPDADGTILAPVTPSAAGFEDLP